MKKEQFDESVNRALYQASRNLELNETLRYLENYVGKDSTDRKSGKSNPATSTFEQKTSLVKRFADSQGDDSAQRQFDDFVG